MALARAIQSRTLASDAAMVRAILDSLALRTAQTARDLAAIAGRSPSRIVVVGGGASNQLLNRLLAATAGLPVWTGPTEATALGNAVVQRAAAVGVVLADLFYHKHGHFGFQEWFAFDAVFGFAAYVGLVNSAKLLRKLVMRPEDYYEAEESSDD